MQRLRRFAKRRDLTNPGGRLYVPGQVAMHVPDGARFECELTDDGILFRLINPDAPILVVHPIWANRLDQNGDGS
jgi:hypothetical protein